MKTNIVAFLLFLFVTNAFKSNASENDSVWKSYIGSGYKVCVLGGDLYYHIKSKVKIEADNPNIDFTVKFNYGTVEKIKKNWYYITPDKIGSFVLNVGDMRFGIQVLPIPEPKLYLDGDKFHWKNVVGKEALLNTTGIEVKNKFTNFEIVSYTISIVLRGDIWERNLIGSKFSPDIKKLLQNIEVGQKFYIENIIVKDPDGTTRHVNAQTFYKVIDSDNNEFIRKTVAFKPYTYDLNLMKTDLRIKITGHPQKKDIKIINDLADELNSILETIKVKIVDRQPSLTIVFDTIKNDSLLIKDGFEKIDEGYKLMRKYLFFPFRTNCEMYLNPGCRAKVLKKNIIELLGEFKDNGIDSSIFKSYNYGDKLSSLDKNMLKTLYSKGGEDKVQTIIDNHFDPPDRNIVFFIMIILTICLLFIFSEIYNYYGLNFLVGKIRFKILKRIIESVLIAQIPVIAFLILLTEKFLIGDFHEIGTCLFLEKYFVPFSILAGVLFLGLDYLLNKIKKNWVVTILNLFLSFFCIWLAYQVIYLFVTPEIVNLSIIGWKIMLIPFLITLYRIYARFQTNKISGLLQEKELELSKQKELKFKSDLNALQARINPHFLYNALNSLASLAYIDAPRTEKMALSLSKLFRYNINKEDEHFSSLKDEIEMAEIYLEIEKNRFEDKLEYSIELQKSLFEFRIPKFILQPLAENAVKHGVSKIVDKGIIRIKIFEQGQKVFIEIYDNGPEFPGGLISGYGLQNTYEKLKLLYKKSFDIEFINKPEKKLVIMLTK